MTHPENDLHYDSDRFSRPRPQPASFDDLADQPDPLVVAQRNKKSTWQAIGYAAGVVFATLLIGEVCSWFLQGTTWAVIASIPPIVGVLACAVIMVRKLNRYERWIPWMGVFWLPLVPFTMWWLTVTVGIIATETM